MKIELFRSEDLDALLELWRACELLAEHDRPEEDIEWATKGAQSQIFLARDATNPAQESDIIGSVIAAHDGLRGRLYRLAVAPEARGKGIAGRLIERGEDWLNSQGFQRAQVIVRPHNRQLGEFYAKHGYTPNKSRVMQKWLKVGDSGQEAGKEDAKIKVSVIKLQMTSPPTNVLPMPHSESTLALMRAVKPNTGFYRYLYKEVGENWFWFKRRHLNDAALSKIIEDDSVEIYLLYVGGVPAGFSELDRRNPGEIELSYLGLIPTFTGQGLGSYLLHATLEIAWGYAPRRVLVSTCSLDHPRALALYQKHGFEAYHQEEIEIIDPRRSGLFDFW